MGRERRISHCNGYCYYDTTPSPPPRRPSLSGFIEHSVSKYDTLAGVAIKYGVEVADIKKMNGLVTDRQMFALKTLQIPLPGRHPPSPCLSNCSATPGNCCCGQNHPYCIHSDSYQSFQSLRTNPSHWKVSPAMSNLQGYYGLEAKDKKGTQSEGLEMAVYRKGNAQYIEDGLLPVHSPASNSPLSLQRKSRSLANGFMAENGELGDGIAVRESREGGSDKLIEKLIRRCQKSKVDLDSHTPETILKEYGSGNGGISARGKRSGLRQKVPSRTSLVTDTEASSLGPIPIGLGDSIVAEGLSVFVRKSSSTPSLQGQESNGNSITWPTSNWNFRPDLMPPIFDGLPKPRTGRRSKAALD